MTYERKPNEIHIHRIYDAPVAAVWNAWCQPDQVTQWWGPRGFTITSHSKDMRPGGVWHYTMHGPDGTDYVNKTLYLEVQEHAKLVYDHGANDEHAPLFRVTAVFEPRDGKTELHLIMALKSPEEAAQTRKRIRQASGNSTWDRLGEYLGKHLQKREVFLIHRSVQAPIERVFEAWTQPQQLKQWLPPTGFTMEFQRVDIRSGGESFYCMTNGSDVTMYGRASYREVRRPDRIVYTQQFCDAEERLARHPHAPTWPATMLTTVTFHDEGEGQTRVAIEWEVFGDATAEEMSTFTSARGGMTAGWNGSFDKLEQHLELYQSKP